MWCEDFQLVISHRDGAMIEAVGIYPRATATRIEGTVREDEGEHVRVSLEEKEVLVGLPRSHMRHFDLGIAEDVDRGSGGEPERRLVDFVTGGLHINIGRFTVCGEASVGGRRAAAAEGTGRAVGVGRAEGMPPSELRPGSYAMAGGVEPSAAQSAVAQEGRPRVQEARPRVQEGPQVEQEVTEAMQGQAEAGRETTWVVEQQQAVVGTAPEVATRAEGGATQAGEREAAPADATPRGSVVAEAATEREVMGVDAGREVVEVESGRQVVEVDAGREVVEEEARREVVEAAEVGETEAAAHSMISPARAAGHCCEGWGDETMRSSGGDGNDGGDDGGGDDDGGDGGGGAAGRGDASEAGDLGEAIRDLGEDFGDETEAPDEDGWAGEAAGCRMQATALEGEDEAVAATVAAAAAREQEAAAVAPAPAPCETIPPTPHDLVAHEATPRGDVGASAALGMHVHMYQRPADRERRGEQFLHTPPVAADHLADYPASQAALQAATPLIKSNQVSPVVMPPPCTPVGATQLDLPRSRTGIPSAAQPASGTLPVSGTEPPSATQPDSVNPPSRGGPQALTSDALYRMGFGAARVVREPLYSPSNHVCFLCPPSSTSSTSVDPPRPPRPPRPPSTLLASLPRALPRPKPPHPHPTLAPPSPQPPL